MLFIKRLLSAIVAGSIILGCLLAMLIIAAHKPVGAQFTLSVLLILYILQDFVSVPVVVMVTEILYIKVLHNRWIKKKKKLYSVLSKFKNEEMEEIYVA